MTVDIAIHGAAGRMGCRLVDLAGQDDELRLVAALEHSGHGRIGEDSGTIATGSPNGVSLSSELAAQPASLIDFSSPHAVSGVVRLCVTKNVGLVLATTGFDQSVEQEIRDAAKKIPIVWAPNMSLAVNLAMKLSEIAASTLTRVESGVDVEILETHHRFKADSPSGTALKFGQRIAEKMGLDSEVHGRHGEVGQRPRAEIGYHAIRAGDDPGQHTILFGMMGEKIEITVAASNRDCYALGALSAAKFVASQPPGLFTMDDVLGL